MKALVALLASLSILLAGAWLFSESDAQTGAAHEDAGEARADGRAADEASVMEVAPAGWKLPLPDHTYRVREGRTLFLHYCATCHGEEGRGDGFNAYSLDPRPRDLADRDFQDDRSLEDLDALIRFGGGAAGLSTGMPPWGRTLSDRQIGYLIDFLRDLPTQSDQPEDN